MFRIFTRLALLLVSCLPASIGYAQLSSPEGGDDQSLYMRGESKKPKTYEIGGISVSGVQFIDEDLLLAVAGIAPGDQIRLPYDEKISRAIQNLWKQDLFADVQVDITKVLGDKVFLNIAFQERPRLSKYNFKNVKKSETQELRTKIALTKSKVVTEATKKEAAERIRQYYVEKGYGNAKVDVTERADSSRQNSVALTFDVNKGNKTKINQINISGNTAASEARLKRTFKGTKETSRLSLKAQEDVSVYEKGERSFGKYMRNFGFLSPTKTLDALDPYFRFRILSSSKYNEAKLEEDENNLVAYYNSLGYRDATIIADTTYAVKNGNINVDVKVSEGNRYYFGDISWRGNTKYTDEELSRRLGIKKGDVYNQELLNSRIGRAATETEDISSLYMDDGYLFFNIDPVEKSIIGDTINYEMRLVEGSQATIGRVNIYGNDRTNEHVIRRELRTLPGSKFRRTDLIRSQREIANLNFFDPQQIGINPVPHPENGTVDVNYTVVEKSSDQLQLSAGFGGGIGIYGNLGVLFNNFSIRNILRPKFWDPLPIGDGQKFSINYQSGGVAYNSFNMSFTEPWLGGKKPNSLTTSFVYSKFAGGSRLREFADTSFLRNVGGGVSLSKRLRVPDDNFVLTFGLNYQNYHLKQYALVPNFNNGYSNNLYFKFILARYSVDQPLYPRNGSDISFTFQFTPPWSSFSNKDYGADLNASEKYKWIEYHKYRFDAIWYKSITNKLVFKFGAKYGFLGYYNKDIGDSPFERYQLGGDGLSGQQFFIGKDIISQRGYEVYQSNATIFNKYTAELRYPFSLSPTSTIYGLAFVDAANAWNSFKDFNPFRLNRDAGLGIRIFLPMFGLLGLDYGVGFDRIDKANGITKFKDISKLTFMLGFEPQ